MPPGLAVGHESPGGSGRLALEKGGGILIDHLFHRGVETEMSLTGAGSGDVETATCFDYQGSLWVYRLHYWRNKVLKEGGD